MAMAGWSELESFETLSVPVRMFRSDASGLRVCLLSCEGPLVSGYTVLATEATTNEVSVPLPLCLCVSASVSVSLPLSLSLPLTLSLTL